MGETLFERIGGDGAVQATVTKMYEKILKDPLLAPFFKKTSMDRLRHSQIAFVTYAFGGPNRYNGKTLGIAHKAAVSEGLSDRHFDAVAQHLKSSMEELNVPASLINEALAIVGSTRKDVLGQ